MFITGLPAKIFLNVVLTLVALCAGCSAQAQETFEIPVSSRWVLEEVSLKNDSGQWQVLARPDHPIDFLHEELGLSFFNQGRIADAKYVNVKWVMAPLASAGTRKRFFAMLKKDLPTPLSIKKNSFISVSLFFGADRDAGDREIQKAAATVDEMTQNFLADEIEFHDDGV